MKTDYTLTIRRMCYAALFMAMNIVLSSAVFRIPVPGGHFYLNDVVICLAAILLDPLYAVVACGLGAFLGDALFYPAPMFVTLVTRSLQALAISLICHFALRKHPKAAAAVGVFVGAVIMVAGYSLGRAFVYSTPEYAWLKLPYQILQAAVGAVAGPVLCFGCGIRRLYLRAIPPENGKE